MKCITILDLDCENKYYMVYNRAIDAVSLTQYKDGELRYLQKYLLDLATAVVHDLYWEEPKAQGISWADDVYELDDNEVLRYIVPLMI